MVRVGSEKREMRRRAVNSQGLKEPMGREKQRSVGTTQAAVAASLCRERRGNCGLNSRKEARGENGQQDCSLSWAASRLELGQRSKPLLSRARLLCLVCPTLLSLTFPIWGTSSLGSSPFMSSNQNRFHLWNQKGVGMELPSR